MKKPNNPIYRIAIQQARKMITNPEKTKNTVARALKKTGSIKEGDKKGRLVQLKEHLFLFFSMIGDFIRGRYRKLPLGTAIKILGAIIYFLFIVDVIPDFLTIIGLTDDAAVLAWVIKSVSKDIEQYKEWKDQQTNDSIEETDIISST